MSLPRYAEYKDSGVAWLGEVPAHWLITPVKRFGRLKGGAGFPHVEQGHESEALPFHKVNALGRAGSDGVLRGSENNISQATAERLGAHVFPPKSLVFAKVGAALLLGRIRVLGEAACIDNNMMGLVVDSETVDFAFVSYALNLVRFDLIANPGAVPSLNEGQIGNFPLVLPGRAEQSAIAAFLDRETGKIDALIAEQEKLLTLLVEKRQATISHAVTRGLTNLPGADLNAAFGGGPEGEGKDSPSNPNAPMKDSGVSWLGEVPAHWSMTRLKWLSPAITVGIVVNPSEYVVHEGLPFIYGGDISEGRISVESCRRISEEGSRRQSKTMLEENDLLTVRVGAPGITAVVPANCVGGNCASVMHLRRGDFDSAWLCYAMNSRMVRYQVEVVQYGAAQEQFNISHAVNFLVATPPRGEQIAISSYVDTVIGRIEALAFDAERAVTLLKERRCALIAAAVTGKIDVRKVV